MAIHIRRREFVFTLGGAAAAGPLGARAQQAAIPAIGFLHLASPVAFADPLRGFHRGLKDAGFVEGENVAIVYRWAEGQHDRLPALAAELVRRQVAVIVAGTSSAAFAAKTATTTIPIVFSVTEDPVALGLVASLARPDGNLTGINWFASELAAKRLELLRELVPGAARVAVLVEPANVRIAESTVRNVEAAARATGLQIRVLNANTSHEIDTAFATLASEQPDALFVGSSSAIRALGGPRGRNERSAAVRQDDEHEQNAASLDAADHRQRLALERVALADDGYLIRDIAEMGSVSPLPSTRSTRTG